MPTTSPDGIVSPDTSYSSGFVAAMAAMATSIQDAFTRRQVQTFRPADAAALAALSGSYTLRQEDRAYKLDDSTTWRWTGSAWAQIITASGLNAVIPTVSGTGVAVGASGKVTLTATSSATITGFTSTYENYLIKGNILASGANLLGLKLSVAGTLTSTGYDTQVFSAVNNTVTAAQALNATSWFATGTAATIQDFEFMLNRPQLASRETAGLALGTSTENPMTTAAGASYRQMMQRATTQFDGINIAPAAGTISGAIRIYGYNNN